MWLLGPVVDTRTLVTHSDGPLETHSVHSLNSIALGLFPCCSNSACFHSKTTNIVMNIIIHIQQKKSAYYNIFTYESFLKRNGTLPEVAALMVIIRENEEQGRSEGKL